MSNTTTVTIPESVTHEHAYAYGYLRAGFMVLDTIIKNVDENDLWDLQYVLKNLKSQIEQARLLGTEMDRRADERRNQIFTATVGARGAEMDRRADEHRNQIFNA